SFDAVGADPLGNLNHIDANTGTSNPSRSQTRLVNRNNRLEEYIPESPAPRTVYSYDGQGRIASITTKKGNNQFEAVIAEFKYAENAVTTRTPTSTVTENFVNGRLDSRVVNGLTYKVLYTGDSRDSRIRLLKDGFGRAVTEYFYNGASNFPEEVR